MVHSVKVRQLTRDIVRIEPHPRFDVSVLVGPNMQALLSDGEDTFVVSLAPPKAGQTITVIRNDDRTVDVVYKTA